MGYVRFRQRAIWQRVLPSLQERLTKALALAGIATIEAANAFIRDSMFRPTMRASWSRPNCKARLSLRSRASILARFPAFRKNAAPATIIA
ncbi:MAG: hypothetical protein WBE80_16035 [Methylocella sp.]